MTKHGAGSGEGRPLDETERTEALEKLLERHANQLSEHFSSVQIIATRLEPCGGTRRFNKGSGDLYARVAASRVWAAAVEDEMLE